MIIELDQQDDVCVLRFKGRLASGQDLEYLLAKKEEIKKLNCGKVLADFREVPSIGSMGIGFLVAIYTSVTRNSAGRFVLVGALPRARHYTNECRDSSSSRFCLGPEPPSRLVEKKVPYAPSSRR
jgi:anti-anti-sigma factor